MSNSDHNHRSSHSEDDDGESLSLCDLPLLSTGSDHEERKQRGIGEQSGSETAKSETAGGDFDFGSLVASLDALESEMCAADEVFFRGQILPFRHSVSSAVTASNITSTSPVTRSNSMDRIVGFGLQSSSTASSSRSSSTRSNSINSSSSTGKLPQLGNAVNSTHKRPPFKVRNQFHSFPSPKPYARAVNAPRSSINSTTAASNHKSRSAVWEIFRLGLVRTPEIELEDLKVRYSKNVMSRNSSSGRSCSGDEEHSRSVENKKRKSRRRKGGAMSLMSSCKCSVGAVEPEKGEREMKVVGVKEEEEKERRRKQDVSRNHRTFEWLKDLSQPVVLNHT